MLGLICHYEMSKIIYLDLGLLSSGGLLSQNEVLAERLATDGVYTLLSEKEIPISY